MADLLKYVSICITVRLSRHVISNFACLFIESKIVKKIQYLHFTVCVHLCVRETETEGQTEIERQRERQRPGASHCTPYRVSRSNMVEVSHSSALSLHLLQCSYHIHSKCTDLAWNIKCVELLTRDNHSTPPENTTFCKNLYVMLG